MRIATTKAHRKLFFNLRKHRSSLESMSKNEIQSLSSALDVPTETVREMEIRMTGTNVSFDGNYDEDSEENSFAPSAYLGDRRFNPEDNYEANWDETSRHQQIENALEILDERSRDIIVQRWLSEEKSTLHVLADKYGVSAERIRQIEEKAMRTMRGEIGEDEHFH